MWGAPPFFKFMPSTPVVTVLTVPPDPHTSLLAYPRPDILGVVPGEPETHGLLVP